MCVSVSWSCVVVIVLCLLWWFVLMCCLVCVLIGFVVVRCVFLGVCANLAFDVV